MQTAQKRGSLRLVGAWVSAANQPAVTVRAAVVPTVAAFILTVAARVSTVVLRLRGSVGFDARLVLMLIRGCVLLQRL